MAYRLLDIDVSDADPERSIRRPLVGQPQTVLAIPDDEVHELVGLIRAAFPLEERSGAHT